jgi:hypothetical protein
MIIQLLSLSKWKNCRAVFCARLVGWRFRFCFLVRHFSPHWKEFEYRSRDVARTATSEQYGWRVPSRVSKPALNPVRKTSASGLRPIRVEKCFKLMQFSMCIPVDDKILEALFALNLTSGRMTRVVPS